MRKARAEQAGNTSSIQRTCGGNLLEWLRAPPASSAAKWITICSLSLCTASGLGTVGLFVRGADLNDFELLPALLGSMLVSLLVSPYLGLATLAVVTRRNTAAAVVSLVGTLLVIGVALSIMFYLFVQHPDPQNAFFLLIIPVYQWAGVIATLVIAAVVWIIERLLRRF